MREEMKGEEKKEEEDKQRQLGTQEREIHCVTDAEQCGGKLLACLWSTLGASHLVHLVGNLCCLSLFGDIFWKRLNHSAVTAPVTLHHCLGAQHKQTQPHIYFLGTTLHISFQSPCLWLRWLPLSLPPNCSFAFVLLKTEIIRVQQCVILLHRIVSRQKEAGKLPDN